MQIGIIGAGWYGCHIALALKAVGYEVEIFEKNSDIFKGVSGNFGIRLHKGPHYPRSDETRKYCLSSFQEFYNTYRDLILEHQYSIYALGKTDAYGNASKVNSKKFIEVCHESKECIELDLSLFGYQEIEMAVTLDEPSIILGEALRAKFREKILNAGINVHYNFSVKKLENINNQKVLIGINNESYIFDKIINATGYQDFLPSLGKNQLFENIEIIYQPCIALNYVDTKPNKKPLSFIIMDGWFPCLMPYADEIPFKNNYILTHGSYTIMASCLTPEKAHELLNNLSNEFIRDIIKTNTEKEMCRFWPDFKDRFEYKGWLGSVLAKLVTKKEFRSAVTFEHDNVIHIIPGKVSNIFDAEHEVKALISNINCIETDKLRFIKEGVLNSAIEEIIEKPLEGEQSTCRLNTYYDLMQDTRPSKIPQTLFHKKTNSSSSDIINLMPNVTLNQP